MLKFWKKKTPAGVPPEPPVDTSDDAPLAQPDSPREDAAETAIEPALPAPGTEDGVANDAPEATTSESVAARRSWRERLSGSGFARGLSGLFARNPVLDDAFLDELETCLLTGDVGVAATTELVDDLRRRVGKREFADAHALLAALRADLVARLAPVEQPLDVGGRRPFVVLVVGVNGVGKTTTIGKLARRLRDEGRSVVLAAGDTFRAAAVEQLQAWGQRNGVPVIAQGSGADSASVIFDALQTARSRG
ncbi:MAG TPA: signal recognition particle receptor subunit alpha, partial [Dokdonella sp.]